MKGQEPEAYIVEYRPPNAEQVSEFFTPSRSTASRSHRLYKSWGWESKLIELYRRTEKEPAHAD